MKDEVRNNGENKSHFRDSILRRVQEAFSKQSLGEYEREKEIEIEAETDVNKKMEKQMELLEAQRKFRRRKFGNITFIGQLYLHYLLSARIILYCVVDLLKSVSKNAEGILLSDEPDEESVECAVRLIELVGKRVQASNVAAWRLQRNIVLRTPPPRPPLPVDLFPLDSRGSEGQREQQSQVPRKADFYSGPKTRDEIKKEIEKEQQSKVFDHKYPRPGMMGSRGSMRGAGFNPKRHIIQRNSQDKRTLEDRRSQAFKSSNLVTRNAPMKRAPLSSVTASDGRSSLGDRKSQWTSGTVSSVENKKDRVAAMHHADHIGQGGQRSSSSLSMKGAEDEGASASD